MQLVHRTKRTNNIVSPFGNPYKLNEIFRIETIAQRRIFDTIDVPVATVTVTCNARGTFNVKEVRDTRGTFVDTELDAFALAQNKLNAYL